MGGQIFSQTLLTWKLGQFGNNKNAPYAGAVRSLMDPGCCHGTRSSWLLQAGPDKLKYFWKYQTLFYNCTTGEGSVRCWGLCEGFTRGVSQVVFSLQTYGNFFTSSFVQMMTANLDRRCSFLPLQSWCSSVVVSETRQEGNRRKK